MSKSEFMRLGYSDEQAEELSKLAKINTCSVSPNLDIEDAVKNLEDFMKQMNNSIIDKLQQPIGYVVTTDDIVDALKKI